MSAYALVFADRQTHARKHARTHVRAYARTHVRTHGTHTRTHTRTVFLHTHAHTHTFFKHTHTHTHTHTHKDVVWKHKNTGLGKKLGSAVLWLLAFPKKAAPISREFTLGQFEKVI